MARLKRYEIYEDGELIPQEYTPARDEEPEQESDRSRTEPARRN